MSVKMFSKNIKYKRQAALKKTRLQTLLTLTTLSYCTKPFWTRTTLFIILNRSCTLDAGEGLADK